MLYYYIRVDIYVEDKIHLNQWEYLSGKSTAGAFHSFTTNIEKAIERKEVSMFAFFEIQGAFEKTSCSTILRAAMAKVNKSLHYNLYQ